MRNRVASDPDFRPSPGDIVVLNPHVWNAEYAGLRALVLGSKQQRGTSGRVDLLIIMADPLCPGEQIHAHPQEVWPWNASLGDRAL